MQWLVKQARSEGGPVHYPLHEWRGRALVALILVSALCATPVISSEIFKCVAKDGTALYQNFPCQFDSIGWKPSNPDVAKTATKPGDASQAKEKSTANNVASTVNATEPLIGMSSDEVVLTMSLHMAAASLSGAIRMAAP
jgi:hypothetical protein